MQLTGGPRNLPAHVTDLHEVRVDGDKALRDNLEFGNYFIINTLEVNSDIDDTVLACRNDGNNLFCIDNIILDNVDPFSTFDLHVVTVAYADTGLNVAPFQTNTSLSGGGKSAFSPDDLSCTNDETANVQGVIIRTFGMPDKETGPGASSWAPIGGIILARGVALGLDVGVETAGGTFTFEGHFVV